MDEEMTQEIGSTSETEIIGSTSEKVVDEDIQSLNPQKQPESYTPPADIRRFKPNLLRRSLLTVHRSNNIGTGLPLYEASIKCDWNAAKEIIDKRQELVRYSITENGETALHVAASAKVPKLGEEFVKNLVGLMTPEDLTLENENFNTALYLAAVAGNIEAVRIMVEKNRDLLKIPGDGRKMMPLYVAALFGNYDVVEYLVRKSNDLCIEDRQYAENLVWLLKKCVEDAMFNTALKIVEKFPGLNSVDVLALLAGMPEAFHETEATIMERALKLAFAFVGSKVEAPEHKNIPLQLLRLIWKEIAKKPKKEIDTILRGPPDSNKHDSGIVVQAMQLQNLIFDHLHKMNEIRGQQDTNPASVDGDQALKIINLISKSLVSMHVETQNIIGEDNKPISGKAHQVFELQKLISENIVSMHDEIQKINEIIVKENQEALQLQRLQKVISDHIGNMKTESEKIIKRPAKKTYSSRVVFIAAEMGNTNFLVELIRQYPDLIWKVDDNNQSIFHIAVKHRHEGIYNLLYEIGSMRDMITPLKDQNDNNMLHLVAQRRKEDRSQGQLGAAFQMQRDLIWFQEVSNIIPRSYRIRKNKDGLTPQQLFTKEHRELAPEGVKWMKEIAGQCMVVAALVATMVFAAAFTVPGGYDQNNGIPIFHSKLSFQIFVVADAISLLLSTASILYMFLSVFTSRLVESDFFISISKILMVGLAFLFYSITSMMIAFSAGFFILYNKGLLWMPILISLFVLIPFIIYMKVQLSLFADVIRSTYGSRYLFKPKKHVLSLENSKV